MPTRRSPPISVLETHGPNRFPAKSQTRSDGIERGERSAKTSAENLFAAPLHQPALVDRGTDEGGKKRVRFERPRLEFGMELHPDEPGMILIFDHLGQ
jgi:hypothetical protein